MHLSAAEVLRGLTCEAARAVGLEDTLGSLEVGQRADLLVLRVTDHRAIPYAFGANPVATVIRGGVVVLEP